MFIEEDDKQTETDEAKSAEEETQTTEQTEAKTETEQSVTEEEKSSETEEVAPVTLEDLLERKDVQRAIQSVSDKAVAKAEQRLSDKAKSQSESTRQKALDDEKRKLVEEGDYETLGQREADRMKFTEELMDHAAKFGVAFTTKMREQYSPLLGEQETERIIDEVENSQGSIVDLTTALSSASQKIAVSSATDKAVKSARDEMKADFDALKAELGVKVRSDDADKGETSSAVVSGTRSETASTEELTYESASAKYGEGDMSWEEFKPFRDQHDKERAR
jgi:hypothetical protein